MKLIDHALLVQKINFHITHFHWWFFFVFFLFFHRFVIICELYENCCRNCIAVTPWQTELYTKKYSNKLLQQRISNELKKNYIAFISITSASRKITEKLFRRTFFYSLALSTTPYSFSHTSRKSTRLFFLSLFFNACAE